MTGGGHRLALVLLALAALGALVVGVAVLVGPDPAPTGPDEPSGPARETVRLLRVVDGDTIVVHRDGVTERVRYVGIDAPELARTDPAAPAECWAERAADAHASLLRGTVLALERDVSDRDRFGRLLRHAWLERGGEWVHVGEELVRAGAARARSYPPDISYDRQLQRAEEAARASNAGLWGSC